MPWNSQGGGGGGPWSGGQGPWGRGSGGGGGGGGGGTPPDIEELLRKSQDRLRRMLPGGSFGGGRGIALVVLAGLVLWGLTGLYRVQPNEIGVVLRFGRYDRSTEEGLHYHLPSPIESVLTPSVTTINRVELGYRTPSGEPRRAAGRDASDESLMLTGDANIVDINFSVFWRINDPEKYLFNIRDPEGTVRVVAESAMREIIGQSPIDDALFERRQAVADQTRDRMQQLLDQYGAGISVTQVQLLQASPPSAVIDAFNDVQRARADQERARNEAETYRNDIIPRARGDAQRIVQEAEAYKEQIADLAQGDAQRFVSVLHSYQLAPDVIGQRLYIETMQELMRGAQKVIVDPQVRNVVPYLPLPELGRATKPATTVQPGSQGAK